MQNLKKIAAGLAVLLIAIQLVPVQSSNPPVSGEPAMSPEVREVLTRSCFDCHSNRTVWPWYSKVAPLSWWIANHVNEGREHLSFSTWDTLSAKDRAKAAEEIVDEVDEAKMPMASYVVGHPAAQLTDADRQVLIAWARGLGLESSLPSEGSGDADHDGGARPEHADDWERHGAD